GAAAGAARDALRVIGVADSAIVGVLAGDPVGELVQVLLAENHRARLAQAAHHRRVAVRNPLPQDGRAGGGPYAGGEEDVLQTDGDAVQRPAAAPRRQLVRQAPRLVERLVAADGEEAV